MIETKYMYSNCHTKEFQQFVQNDYRRSEKLRIKTVENGLVLPLKTSRTGVPLLGYGGVLDAKEQYVIESAQIGKGDTADRFIGKYNYNPCEVETSEEEVIYIGALPLHWGHFLIDMVHRFWIFDDEKFLDKKIVYCSNNAYFQGVQLDFIKILGIDPERLSRIGNPTRFRKIYIPEQGYMACDYYSQEYRNTFLKLVNNSPRLNLRSYEKIYLSRGHFRKARKSEIGERNIESNFSANGFHVLYMEELSLAEQIFYISHCKIVAALSGTLCHNILFANSSITLIILNKTHLLNTHQVLINQMIGCKVIYVDVYIEPFRHTPSSYGSGPFLLGESKLKEYFEDNDMKYRKSGILSRCYDFLMYLKMCLQIKGQAFFSGLYVTIYYKACKYKCIIIPLRCVKNTYSRMRDRRKK